MSIKNLFMKKHIIKKIVIALFCMVLLPNLKSQVVNCQPTGVQIELNNNCNNINRIYQARDKVSIKPGYRFQSTNNGVMKARLNETLILPKGDYQTNQILENEIEIDKSLNVGLISGSSTVNIDGSAGYNIPIGIPKGTAGIEPNLSIVYNSNMPNGMLGKGWSISGLSSITRSSKTVFNNTNDAIYNGQSQGDLSGVNLNYNDYFSLDGNRLAVEDVANTNSYGNGEIYYRTFIESYVRVKSHGTCGNGPDWFEVFMPDGSIAEYGKMNNSKNIPQGVATPITWNVNKITDRFGNYMEFFYKIHNFEVVIEKIVYTGNSGANMSPYNTILFLYDEKQDQNFYFSGGSKINQNLLLRKIKISTDNIMINEYSFNYYFDNALNASKLTEIGMTINGQKINSTKILWNEQSSEIAEIINSQHEYTESPSRYLLGDFLGEGKMQIMRVIGIYDNENHFQPLVWKIYSNFYSTPILTGVFPSILNCPEDNFLDASDINGDGKDELAVFHYWDMGNGYHKYRHQYFAINENQLTPVSNIDLTTDFEINNPTANYFDKEIDFNGDGIVDRVILLNSTVVINGQTYLKKYLGVKVTNSSNPGLDFELNEDDNFDKIEFIDHNGNGKTDIVTIRGQLCNIYEYVYNSANNSYSFEMVGQSGFPTVSHQYWYGDFNGDGKTDIITYSNNVYQLNYSDGINYTWPPVDLQINVSPQYLKKIIDLNGDGKDDILFTFDNIKSIKYFEILNDGQVVSKTIDASAMQTLMGNHFLYGDITGDGKIDIFQRTFQNQFSVIVNKNDQKANFVSAIYDGYKNKTEFYFQPLTSSVVYSKICESCPNDLSLSQTNLGKTVAIQAPFYVANQMKQYDANGLLVTNQSFFYERLKYNPYDRSLVGFSRLRSIDYINNVENNQYFNSYNIINFLRINQPVKTETLVFGSQQLVSTIDYDVVYEQTGGLNRLKSGSTKTTSVDLLNNTKNITEQTPFFETTTTYRIESVKTKTYSSTDAPESDFLLETKVNKKYEKYTFCQWFATKPVEETLTKTLNQTDDSPDVYNRTTQYTYDNDELQSVINDPNVNDKKVITSFSDYNVFGFACQTTISAPNDNTIQSITNAIEFDSRGRFILKKTNSLNQFEEFEYTNLGLLTCKTSINGLRTKYYYNNLFRLNKIEYPDAIIETTETNWVDADPQLLYKTTQSATGSNPIIVYYDGLGRNIKTQSQDINNNTIFSKVEYQSNGLLYKESLPYSENETPLFKTYQYDNLNRNTSIENPDLSLVEYVYNPLEIITKQSKNNVVHTQKKKYNALGQLTESTDNNSNSVEYEYFASGLIKKTKILNVATEFAYDIQGNRTLLVDPSAGTITAEFDAFGRINKQTKPNNLITLYQYDVLGRVVSKSDIDGTVTYQYDTKPNGKGKIDFVEHTNGTKTEFMYDNLGRTNQIIEHIGNNSFIQKHQYNNLSQLTKLTYPDNYDISYVYKNGNIHKIIETVTSNVLWEAIDIDSKGNITQSKIGNLTQNKIFDLMGRLTHKNSKRNATFVQSWDYQYDAMNNIKSRVDNISLQGENFTYDNLNRLLDVYQGPLNQQFIGLVQSMNYDNLGNMTHKTDVGDMQYSTTYPFQMETLTENPQTINSEHVLEYYVSGRTKTIVNNDDKLQFTYGSDLQRRKMEYFLEDQLQTTTLYPFGNFEEVHNATTSDVVKFNYIGSPDGLIAIRKTINGSSQLYYVLTDHLGSIDALCNTNGDVVERYSYDAWGNRRNPTDWSQADIRTTWITTRGFTGHEHLDKFGLINTNARMYEPLTGKFLAPDPFVQAPDYSQSFNRYAYCFNNPLKYTDPNGEFIFTLATLIAAPFTGGASLALLPAAIGADIGMWQGGMYANNGQPNPLKWDYSSGRTWGNMVAGGIVGGISGWVGGYIAQSGINFSGTLALMGGSATNSLGFYAISSGETDLSVNFGFGSYNISKGELGYLGKKGNSPLENFGYLLGAVTNASDIYRYATWGALSPQEKVNKLKKNYKNENIIYDESLSKDAQYDENTGKMSFGNSGLNNGLNWAKSSYDHEFQHIQDFIKQPLTPSKYGEKEFIDFLETRAYNVELRNFSSNRLSYNMYMEVYGRYLFYCNSLGLTPETVSNFNIINLFKSLYF